jgi:hypothetical protein
MKRRASPENRRAASGLMQRRNVKPATGLASRTAEVEGEERKRDDLDGGVDREETDTVPESLGNMAEREDEDGVCERVSDERCGSDVTTTRKAPPMASAVPAELATASPSDNHSEQRDFGNLPLIDIWVAQGKGYTQDEIEATEGWAVQEDHDLFIYDGIWPPISKMRCDGRFADVSNICWPEDLGPIPDE